MFSKKLLIASTLFSLLTVIAAPAENPPESPSPTTDSAPESAFPEAGLPATWLQGVPVKHWEKDKVYVFEFWATWCGPCISSIPHIESVHGEITAKKLNAQIIGVNIRDKTPPESLKQFLAKQRVVPTYTIAVDTGKNTDTHWIRPLKIRGIPYAIAVRNGTVIWSGHPIRLNAQLIEDLADPDFEAKAKAREAQKAKQDALREQAKEIALHYAKNETDQAEALLSEILSDGNASDDIRKRVLDLACLDALTRGNFKKMNAYLRYSAEAFPQDGENLYRVAQFILESDDIPESELNLALAEECLNKALPLSRKNTNLHRKQLRMAAKIHALRKDRKAELDALNACFRESTEGAWLTQLGTALKDRAETANAAAIYAALEKGSAGLPAEFKIQAAEKSASRTPSRVFEKSSTPENDEMLNFLSLLDWIRGNAPESLPANGIVAVTFWEPPAPGPRSMLSFHPTEWLDKKIRGYENNIPVYVVSIENTAGRTAKVLNFPRYATPFPVGVISREKFSSAFNRKINYQNLPETLILRDGKTLWQGRAQDLPEWIITEAALPSYDAAKAEREREIQKKEYGEKLNFLRGIRLSDAAGNLEVEKNVKAFRETLKSFPALYMRATGILSDIAYARRDFKAVGEICASIINEYPDVKYIAQMQLNILNSNTDLRAATLPVVILAYRNILGSGEEYASAYWQAISQVYAEMHDWENAVYAAFAARNTSDEWQAIQKLKSAVAAEEH